MLLTKSIKSNVNDFKYYYYKYTSIEESKQNNLHKTECNGNKIRNNKINT